MAVSNAIKLPIAAVAGALIAGAIFEAVVIPAARKGEADRVTAITNQAIGELGNAADQARVRRRLCIGSGGLWDFAKGQCSEREPAQ